MDDLEAVTGELVANALEHSDSPLIAIMLALGIHQFLLGDLHDHRHWRTAAGLG